MQFHSIFLTLCGRATTTVPAGCKACERAATFLPPAFSGPARMALCLSCLTNDIVPLMILTYFILYQIDVLHGPEGERTKTVGSL